MIKSKIPQLVKAEYLTAYGLHKKTGILFVTCQNLVRGKLPSLGNIERINDVMPQYGIEDIVEVVSE